MGGFPEPFLDDNEEEARRWRRERINRVIRDDIRDPEPIRDIQTLSLLVTSLRTRVGGPVVFSNIAQDLQVAPQTITRWLEVLERMYLVFSVRPYTKNILRSIQKVSKDYFFDNADVIGDEGARFENLVATHLLKKIQFLEDKERYTFELCYLKDREGRKVDFGIMRDGVLQEIIEVKYSDSNVSSHLRYFAERLNPESATQVVAYLKRPYS